MRTSQPFKRVYFEPQALEYPLGQRLHRHFTQLGTVPVHFTTSHNRLTGPFPREAPRAFSEAKRTLVVGVKRSLDFPTCRPSAHFQLPLATGCPGFCHYCYLHTTLGKRPYVRVYVNLEAILSRAADYLGQREPEITVFEGSATADPLAVEPLTGSLALAIAFFGEQPRGRFRFATKYDQLEGLLQVPHQGHTRIRFSINTPDYIARFEKGSLPLERRLEACRRAGEAGYPVGLMIAPIFLEPGWHKEYAALIAKLGQECHLLPDVTFELVTHRFTRRARSNIDKVFPGHTLPMDESQRQFKYGQFGYGKYVYPLELRESAREEFQRWLEASLPQSRVEYLV